MSEKELRWPHKTRYRYVQYKNTINMRQIMRLYLRRDRRCPVSTDKWRGRERSGFTILTEGRSHSFKPWSTLSRTSSDRPYQSTGERESLLVQDKQWHLKSCVHLCYLQYTHRQFRSAHAQNTQTIQSCPSWISSKDFLLDKTMTYTCAVDNCSNGSYWLKNWEKLFSKYGCLHTDN